MTREPRRESPLALRARITITFALVTLCSTLLVSVSTFYLARQYLIEQRERSSIRQTFLNARLARDLLESGERQPQEVLDATVGEVGTLALLRVDGKWYASGVAADPNDLPASIIAALDEDVAAHQRVVRAGQPRLIVGVPLANTGTDYLEIVPLGQLQRTFRTLVISLLIGSAGTTVAGMFVGMYVSRRVLRPLTKMSVVAAGITAGDTTARLDAQGDRDLVSLVDSFNEMVDALQARIVREQRFASDVSHEMRTPLTVLKAAVQIVEGRAPDLPPRAMEAVEMMSRQVSYFERLVLDLLEISRLDAGVDQPELEQTDLVEFVDMISAAVGGPTVTSTPEGPLRIGVDRRRVERIVRNLLENAERYAGGATALMVGVDGRFATITVDDSGGGIPVDERSHLFERFWRGRDARHQESKGSGLGLALVADHLRLLGGSIEVGTSASDGARFIVRLPIKEGW
ncbi:MAG: HAMP domain-containing sensor histidine kinase [Ilumatobacteraceae bacterium]